MPTTSLTLPDKKLRPLYAIDRSYLDNLADGPQFNGPYPERNWPQEMPSFLGYPIASPIGVPAGPLLSSDWIICAAQLGFDILTYKTIRHHRYDGNGHPNVVFVDIIDRDKGLAQKRDTPPPTLNDITITNSFGNPSRNPSFLQADIEKSRTHLHLGQILIVSVFGIGETLQQVKEDFVRTAILAKEAGAQIIEANFSCPNVSKSQGSSLFLDEAAATTIAQAIVNAIAPLPLIIKTGTFPNQNSMRTIYTALARSGVSAIQGINTIPMKVTDKQGNPGLDSKRLTSGICGAAIRPDALKYIQWAHDTIKAEKLDIKLMGCGGITSPEHFDQFLERGASIALTATGMMWDPYLAMRWHQRRES